MNNGVTYLDGTLQYSSKRRPRVKAGSDEYDNFVSNDSMIEKATGYGQSNGVTPLRKPLLFDIPQEKPKYNKIFKDELPYFEMNNSQTARDHTHVDSIRRHNHSNEDVHNCISIAGHVKHCPICQQFYKCDKRLYIMVIVFLMLLSGYLLRRVLNEND